MLISLQSAAACSLVFIGFGQKTNHVAQKWLKMLSNKIFDLHFHNKLRLSCCYSEKFLFLEIRTAVISEITVLEMTETRPALLSICFKV